MAARTVLVELLSPSRAKQEAFLRLQADVVRLGQGWAEATAGIAQAVGGSLESGSLAPLAEQASGYATRTLAAALQSCAALPEPWRSTLRAFLRQQLAEVRTLRRRARAGTAPPLTFLPSPGRERQVPVVFGQDAWQIQVADGKWKLVIPLFGRTVAIPVAVPPGQTEALRRLMAEGIPLEGRLFRRRGRWFFAARYLNQAPPPRPDAPAIGVDLGESLRAVALEPASGRRLVLSGRRDRAIEHRYRRLAQALKGAGQTRKARALEAKLERFRLQRDREVAGQLVAFAKTFDRPVVKVEADQDNPRFQRTIRMTARRAEPLGIAVVAVDGHASSIRCSACGAVDPRSRKGSRFRCRCGHGSHADLNAAKNLSRTATWGQSLQLAAAEQRLGGEAVGTAERATRGRYKGGTAVAASPPGHAVSTEHQTLAAPFRKEEYPMASIVKDLSESSTKFVVGTLDNLKSYVDKTSEELSKVDLVNVSRHILDTALDGAKNVVKTASEPSSLDAFGRLKAMADGSLEATREVVNVIAEEGKKADVFGMSTRIALEGINSLRAEVDLGLDTTKNLVNRLAPLATTAKPVVTRPPQVTRVEIEHEKPASKSSKSSSAS